jgi:MFS superfamily sulfate permease-like transporter
MLKLARGLSLSRFHREWLTRDIVAGIVLTTLLVPQGMAYAELAGLLPITGLYTSIMCLLGYAVFGPSRILVLGPDSSLGPMIAAVTAFRQQTRAASSADSSQPRDIPAPPAG